MANKNNNQNSYFNTKITLITIVAAVWIICLVIILARCELTKKEVGTTTHPDAVTSETEAITNPYESQQSGTVKKADSKTLEYFNTHFKNDYYNVVEVCSQTLSDGIMYQTMTRAYTTEGYIYEKMNNSSYYETDYSNSVIRITTPEASYILYPEMKTYFKGESTSKGYTNTMNFPGEQFKTGKIKVEGIEYYYEELPVENGITTKYCFDAEDNLKYRISTSQNGSVTETYMEYSSEVDPSLFEIPEDYMLQE